MKRFHVHVTVAEIEPSVAFYSALFGAEPAVLKPDYAKWMIDDPRINFAISRQEKYALGINHLGVQVETDAELAELHGRLASADIASRPEVGAQCCYATSNKHWTKDPTGVVWEAYRSMGEIAVFGEDRGHEMAPEPAAPKADCCA